jgi:diaminopimelate epimerase
VVKNEFVSSHYSGCGNDFLLIDARKASLPLSSLAIQTLCSPKKGAGVDGLMVVSRTNRADVAMKFYNADGLEAEMCGNGVRCLMKFLLEKGRWTSPSLSLEAKERIVKLHQDGNEIIAEMGNVTIFNWNIALSFHGHEWIVHHLDTGVPHIVTFVPDVASIDVETIGSFFRRHPNFIPKGTNVNFVEIPKQGRMPIAIRTFERGVERETLACGTGASAVAIALHKIYGILAPIQMKVKSNELLTVFFDEKGDDYLDLRLKGPARWIKDCKLIVNSEDQSYTLELLDHSV